MGLSVCTWFVRSLFAVDSQKKLRIYQRTFVVYLYVMLAHMAHIRHVFGMY